MANTTTILHISDLHIESGPEKHFDRSVVLDPLLKRVAEDRENGLKPELVVVTGDIAFKGITAEYEVAVAFFDDLLGELQLGRNRLFIIPGNHDVNRKAYRPTDIPKYDTMRELNKELEQYRDDLFRGMKDYFTFAETNYPHLKPLSGNLIPFVLPYTTESGRTLGLIGLNSAWMCRKSPDEKEVAIGEFQVKNAVLELAKLGNTDLNLFLFHHSINHLWPPDRACCRSQIDGNKTILLTGHLHEAAGWIVEDYDGRLVQFQAGGAYLGSESAWPARYQYLSLDWDANKLWLNFRAYDKDKRKWHVDAKTGDDGRKEFPLFTETKPDTGGKRVEAEFPETYRTWIIENYRHLDAEKLCGGEMIPVSLPEIFIPLFGDALVVKIWKKGKSGFEPGERKPSDLEELVAMLDALVLEGHPGSGKTTLLKHITYCLARQDTSCEALAPLAGRLPLLMFMKDLNAFFDGMSDKKIAGISAYHIIEWYCANRLGSVIGVETIQAFVEQGRAVLLLDGFDELLPEFRAIVVNCVADLRIKHPKIRLVLAGRPHGLANAAFKRFWGNRVKINSLTMEQVELFVNKWFNHFYPGTLGPGGRTAAGLIGEVRTHPAIDSLIDTPLMLTAICILYHDQRKLPNQRAELYKRFIDNMLYRRFGGESGDVLEFLKLLAFRMHTAKTKTTDEKFALEALRSATRKRDGEDTPAYEARTKARFAGIEAQCGLLKFEAGQYEFRHLSFQEFLCGDYIFDNTSDGIGTIDKYWDDDWFDEMIELYISHVSIRNKATANDIVKQALEHPGLKRCLLASAALNDIQDNRRDHEIVVPLAKKRLMNVFTAPETDNRILLARAGELLGWLGDPRDLKEFVPIPGGEYVLEELGKVILKPYELGRYPVVNRWFGEFVANGGYREKVFWSEVGWKWLEESKAESPKYWNGRRWCCPNAPVVGICWYEAEAFCRWLTLVNGNGYEYRLPAEPEWQAAAAGRERRKYAWGNENEPERCNCGDGKNEIEKTSPVGIFKRGKTPEGIHDLSGNVWEWCQNLMLGTARVRRGGDWNFNARRCRSAFRSCDPPDYRSAYNGFRLARSQKGQVTGKHTR